MPEFDLLRFMDKAEWAADANCRGLDTNLFFPDRGELTAPIKLVCHCCDVQAECLAYALNNDEKHGIWGGTSERERRSMRRRRKVLATGPLRRHVPVEEHATNTGYQQHVRAGTPPLPGVSIGAPGLRAV